ncbi:MAG: 2-oxoacid:acceptor oxidoreductase family protein [Nitrospirae bacterium]|nr:MAG: 2-oxoglutarate ferredoxin oxidoreductase subunit gamma [Nitrospirota bacterium]MBI5204720.1 2-oxoacid:acceptor oxidoreductase family protein [Nitrospirota bacterium]
MELEHNVLIAGFGGQGILFFGKLLAYSGMLEGKEVTWFPSYGAEVRGGTANCTVIISDDMIGSPIVRNPEILVVMNEASLNKFQPRLKKEGLLIFDSSLIKKPELRSDIHVADVPASEIAASIGNTKCANIVMLSALLAKAGIIKEESALKALEELTPPKRRKSLDINKDAITKGRKYIEDKKSKDN